jgi:YHS domain-containing protein
MTRIHCDGCNQEIAQEKALPYEQGEEVLYFCSQECLERMRVTTPRLWEDKEDEKR